MASRANDQGGLRQESLAVGQSPQAPGPNDIRGPCPGLNAAANHNFLAHDGVTTFTELVDAQQNLYNVGYDLATLLATLGVVADGDILTGKLSIGCDATSRTATLGGVLGREPGLNGHNKFEGDTSLTRNDYFTHDGDNYSFNGTLFARMKEVADRVSGGNFDRNALAAYRSQRYDESVQENPNFFFGPLSLLLFGAASFLYELFPSNEKVLTSLRGLAAALPAGGYLVYTNQPWHPQVEFIARVLDNRDGKPWIMRRL